MEVYLVEGGIAATGKPVNDLSVGSAVGQHRVKVVLNILRELGDFAARLGNLNKGRRVKVWCGSTGVKVRFSMDLPSLGSFGKAGASPYLFEMSKNGSGRPPVEGLNPNRRDPGNC